MSDSLAIVTTPNNRTLYINGPADDKSVMRTMLKGKYEPSNQALMESFISPNDHCLDIGANLGQHTTLMAKLGRCVDAVEASSENCQYIRKNIKANELLGRVNVTHCGMWDENTTAELSYKKTNNACSFFADAIFCSMCVCT